MADVPSPEMDRPEQITFKYIVPDHVADCFVSGFYGGVAPSRKIYCHFFSERPAIPTKETLKLKEDGTIGRPLAREKDSDIVRLVQSSIVFDLHTAKDMMRWLQNQVDHLEKRNQE